MTSSSFSVSAIGRLEVGSSRITRRELKLSALAISTICCWASDSARHRRRGREVRAEPVEIGLHRRAQLVGVDQLEEAALARLAADIDVGGDVEIVEEVEFLMDEGDAGADRAADGERADRATPSISMVPRSGCDDAAEDLHQRRFAGAVFADEADDLAGADVHAEVGERHDAGIGLATPVSLRNGSPEAGMTAGAADGSHGGLFKQSPAAGSECRLRKLIART